jgi:DNA polymerase I-like protein with 3'-5' exonuclease and polymerase domains
MLLPDTISFDLETTGLDAKIDSIFSIQIGTGLNNYLIDLQNYDTPLIKSKDILFNDVIPFIKNKILIGQNISFDLKFLYMKDFYPDKVFDTMIASKILHNGEFIQRHSFGEIMERELGLIYDKSEQKNIHKIGLSTQKAIKYCFNDVDKLLELHDNLHQKMENYKCLPTYYLNCNFLLSLAYMELCGLPIDVNLWKNKMKNDEKNSLELQEEIKNYIYDKLPKYRYNQLTLFDNIKRINTLLSSPSQMIPVFKDLGINVVDDKGKLSINEKVINKTKHEFVDLWLKYKESEHRVNTFGKNVLEVVKYGHIYTSFNPIVDTCRVSVRKGGINFLNFPRDKETRMCFKGSKGFKIVGCDYDSQENVVLANLSEDPVMIDNIVNNRDSHSRLARVIFSELEDLTDEDIKKNHSEKRQFAKVSGFSFAFGGNGYTASKNQNVSIEEGERTYKAYKELYSGVSLWGEKTLSIALEKGYIESTDGFKVKLPFYDDFLEKDRFVKGLTKEFWGEYKEGKEEYKLFNEQTSETPYIIKNQKAYDLYRHNKEIISDYFKRKSEYSRLCLNFPCQSTAAHQSKLAMYKLFCYIKEKNHLRKVRISNFIYD